MAIIALHIYPFITLTTSFLFGSLSVDATTGWCASIIKGRYLCFMSFIEAPPMDSLSRNQVAGGLVSYCWTIVSVDLINIRFLANKPVPSGPGHENVGAPTYGMNAQR